ncbi:PRC-barrel domain containing protein [Halobacteria archaeon AArc-m2/3/4]|uniref:PRC-barrel domain containing protein n=1 Tax=Natronoglomus mannanivorans TaxID=2979990 RepID=A0AAP3E1H8_9EURY|nr:PRC-barrel domain containing protein [Halobacteria archaeon AArc-xg1-1]MCU4973299.1 PRC-barrel domain containing protein [Halobacteria archaeon AArc-m2/3/4]
MCATFTDDDEGKRVVNANGEEIGMIQSVEGGAVHVDPDPGMADSIKSKLGWGDSDEETYMLDEDNVESISDDEVRLHEM